MLGNSIFFSISPAKSFVTVIKFALISSIGYLSLKTAKNIGEKVDNNSNKIIYALIVYNLILIIEHVSYYPVTRYLRNLLGFNAQIAQPIDRVTVLFTILSPYLYMNLYRKNFLYLLLIIITCISYILHPMNAATLAFFGGWLVILLYKIISDLFLKIYFFVLGIILLTCPWLMEYIIDSSVAQNILPKLQASWAHRIKIWQRSIELIKEKSLVGWGVNSSSVIDPIIPLHPHNFFLQIWLELGLVGVNIVLLALVPIYYSISRTSLKEALLGSLTISIIFASISFGIWQSWFLSAIWIGLICNIYFSKKQ
ncbi:MAG: O-antigen ligase family protein [Alphaproteobacteria bacterium]